MSILQTLTSGISKLIATKVFVEALPFLKAEGEILVESSKLAIQIFLSDISKEEKKLQYDLLKGQFAVFVESLKREGQYMGAAMISIFAESAFDEVASLLGFGE